MKTTTGKGILIMAALILGMARIALLPAIIAWVVTAGTVVVVERLIDKKNR